MGGEARQSLVDGVVDHLIHQMVKSPAGYIADIHRRTLPYSLQPLQHVDIAGAIVFLVFFVYHILWVVLFFISGYKVKHFF